MLTQPLWRNNRDRILSIFHDNGTLMARFFINPSVFVIFISPFFPLLHMFVPVHFLAQTWWQSSVLPVLAGTGGRFHRITGLEDRQRNPPPLLASFSRFTTHGLHLHVRFTQRGPSRGYSSQNEARSWGNDEQSQAGKPDGLRFPIRMHPASGSRKPSNGRTRNKQRT